MREVVIVCRSRKKARVAVARVLDAYFWRIADRTWRGKASNACLDRVSRELRRSATRNTAIAIYEIRSAHESRRPLIRIGAKSAFSDEGRAPIASQPARLIKITDRGAMESTAYGVVRIAALFHDLGKATNLFQESLRAALAGAPPRAAVVRHELFSAFVWDHLFGRCDDAAFIAELKRLTEAPETLVGSMEGACEKTIASIASIMSTPEKKLPLWFWEKEGSLVHAIGALILSHHRLPAGDSDLIAIRPDRHVRPCDECDVASALQVAPGLPFWQCHWWQRALARSAALLSPGSIDRASLDLFLRASMMLADHTGSAAKVPNRQLPDHVANTTGVFEEGRKTMVPADDLATHTRRVFLRTRASFDTFHRYRHCFPALDEEDLPSSIPHPESSKDSRFQWQAEAARSARALTSSQEGGFFACLTAGTGTGKTRAAPTILANAAFGDSIPERRYFRMSLGLGLRVLATQSAAEYVDDLGFADKDVSVLVGKVPLGFAEDDVPSVNDGSESVFDLPPWLRAEYAAGSIPREGDVDEECWIQGLSKNTDRFLPAFVETVINDSGRPKTGRLLLETPIMVGTIDHLMWVASPLNTRFLLPAIRLAASDLVLDEIDQFGGEDLSAVARLVFQAGVGGRRVILMSATMPQNVAQHLYDAYASGWSRYAKFYGITERVNVLVSGDASGSCVTNTNGQAFSEVFRQSVSATVRFLGNSPPMRRAILLPPCSAWDEIVGQVDSTCSTLHKWNAVKLPAGNVSVGLVKMTRISHTAALAAQLAKGRLENGHFRLVVCLHSQFPRVHRAWIESELKRALTRKGTDAHSGLENWLNRAGISSGWGASGCPDLEIVVVCSPVIETGNDLDFDYGILDPVTLRSVVQSAGRVYRHRRQPIDAINLAILGRPTVAVESGKLEMPGVETRNAAPTRVAAPSLEFSKKRQLTELFGDFIPSISSVSSSGDVFLPVDARWLFLDVPSFPWREAEERLISDMLGGVDGFDPLGRYFLNSSSRMNQSTFSARRFRRSSAHTLEFAVFGDGIDMSMGEWRGNLAPGTNYSTWFNAIEEGLFVVEEPSGFVFESIPTVALREAARSNPGLSLNALTTTEIANYGDAHEPPEMTFCHVLGFTRGPPAALHAPFGRVDGAES